jgi:hypothetical protein
VTIARLTRQPLTDAGARRAPIALRRTLAARPDQARDGSEPGARIVYLSGSDGRPIRGSLGSRGDRNNLRTGRALRKPGRQAGQRKNRIPD